MRNDKTLRAEIGPGHWAWPMLLLLVLVAPVLHAELVADVSGPISALFPDMQRLEINVGHPPSTAVYSDTELLGVALQTIEVTPIPAYSGKPIDTLVGFDLQGRIEGIRILAHEEPILVAGVSEEDLIRYANQYVGLSIVDDVRIGGDPAPGKQVIDGLSGATITAMVLNRSIIESARNVATARGMLQLDAGGRRFEPPPPLWLTLWHERLTEVVLLVTGLVILTLILLFQDWLARHPTLLIRVRTAYLWFTLMFIGVYGLAQLSIVNVFTFVKSLLGGFSWESFLIEPMMFLLWSFVAVSILLWGRGVYCGWLCPFGALQELLFRAGQRLGVKSFELPSVVHERLLAVKYLVLLGLFALSLQSLTTAELYAEVEPFKTVFALRFLREWGFVVYAVLLLVIALFLRKAFCRYLCPLGAALTFPSRFRIFDWLRRRRECGKPCQICARECEVQAIRPTGEIVDSECHYCLDCQVTYWDDHRCPPLVERRKKAEVKARLASVPRD